MIPTQLPIVESKASNELDARRAPELREGALNVGRFHPK